MELEESTFLIQTILESYNQLQAPLQYGAGIKTEIQTKETR